jgi:hypothetical protein
MGRYWIPLLGVASAIVMGGLAMTVLDKLSAIMASVESRSSVVCVVGSTCLKFHHESELILPPIDTKGCAPYKLPEMAQLPNPDIIRIPPGASEPTINKILLEYIDKVMDNDRIGRAMLMQNYQTYLLGCSPPAPTTPPVTPAPVTPPSPPTTR